MNSFRLHRFFVLIFITFSAVCISLSCSKKDEQQEESCCELAGDINGDGHLSITDLTFLVKYLGNQEFIPSCFATADVNNDCTIDTLDINYYIDFIFVEGPAPECGCAPNPEDNNSNHILE